MRIRATLATSVVCGIGLLSVLAGCNRPMTPPRNDTPVHSGQPFNPNSTSEPNRQMIRDEMIRRGSRPDEAEVFTREVFRAEKDHRRQNGLPDY